MTIVDFLLLLLVAAICGSIGQLIAGVSYGGCLMSAVVGFVGALIGWWLARNFGFPEPLPVQIGPETFPVVWSVIGSALLVFSLSLITRRRI